MVNLETLERRLEGLYYRARLLWREGKIRQAEAVERVIAAYEEAWNDYADKVVG